MSLDVFFGPMCSGKTTRFIQRIRLFKTLSYPIMVIKPDIDVRYTKSNEICTHNLETETCVSVSITELNTLLERDDYKQAKVLMIEEGQFFTGLYDFVKYSLDVGRKQIYITALNGDSQRQLFGEMYQLLPLCTNIEFLQALCIRCKDGTPGVYSKRISASMNQIEVGGTDQYETVCLEHYLE